jgi:hypothetical protein
MPIPLLPASRCKRACLLSLLILLPFVSWICLWLSAKDGSFTRPDFDRIQPRMTIQEVQSVIDPSAEWQKLTMGGPPAQYLIVWEKWDASALLFFDKSGRLASKEYSPQPRTTRGNLRAWWCRNIGFNPPF